MLELELGRTLIAGSRLNLIDMTAKTRQSVFIYYWEVR
jgi:hypothetical protein